jgi:nucleoside-diphosphate-sugar epimerase
MGSAPVHVALNRTRIDARKAQPSSPGSDFLYDLTKCLQESIARQFCETHGMTAITLRAGHIVDGRAHRDPNGTPLSELRYCRGGWICRYDLARAVVAALGWKGRGYEAFYIIGARQARETFDVERAEAMLGITLDTNFSEYEAS